MSRLTERNESGGISVKDISAALAKLSELEDAAQDGRALIKAAMKDCDDCPFFEEANDSCTLDDAPPSAWDVWGMSAEEEQAPKEGTV